MKTKRSTFKVLFYVKRTAARVSDGKAPVMARITIDGDIATFSAKLFVTPSLWNAEAGKVSGKSAEALEINPQLEEIKARINNHYYQILRADDFVTSEKVRNAFLGIGVMENCILKDFQTMNREFGEMVEKKLRAKSTYNKYLTVYKHLEAFMWEKRKRTDMAYKELTKDFIDDFDSYLRNEKGLERKHPLDLHHAHTQPYRQGLAQGNYPHRSVQRVQPRNAGNRPGLPHGRRTETDCQYRVCG